MKEFKEGFKEGLFIFLFLFGILVAWTMLSNGCTTIPCKPLEEVIHTI